MAFTIRFRMTDAADQLDLFDPTGGNQTLRVAFIEPPDRESLGGSLTSTNPVIRACKQLTAEHGWIFNHRVFSEYIVSLNDLANDWHVGAEAPDLVVAVQNDNDWASGLRTGQAISAETPLLIISPNRFGVRPPRIEDTKVPSVRFVKCASLEQVARLTADWCVEQAIHNLGFQSREIQVTSETKDRQYCHRVWATLDELKRRSIANMIGIDAAELQSILRENSSFIELGSARWLLLIELQLSAENERPVRPDFLPSELELAERSAFGRVVVQRNLTDRQAALLLERGIRRKRLIGLNPDPELIVTRGSLDTEQAWRQIARDII